MRIKKSFTLVFIVFCFVIQAFGQDRAILVKGDVLDESPSGSILIKNTNVNFKSEFGRLYTVKTSDDGKFEITLPAGKYIVEVDGFLELAFTFQVSEKKNYLPINFLSCPEGVVDIYEPIEISETKLKVSQTITPRPINNLPKRN